MPIVAITSGKVSSLEANASDHLYTVGDTAAQIVSSNKMRNGLLLFNAGDNRIFIGLENTVTHLVHYFAFLDPKESLTMDGGFYCGNLYAICSTGVTSKLGRLET